MKRILILLLFIALSHITNAQRFYTLNDDKKFIDSLKTIISETKSDSIKCINLFKLADLFRRNKYLALSDTCLAQANELAPKYYFLLDLSIYYNAATYLKQGDFEGYEKQLIQANEKLKKYNTGFVYSVRAFIMKNVAVLLQMQNKERQATEVLINEAIPLAKRGNDLEVTATIYTALGIIFMNSENRTKADEYLRMAVDCAERSKASSYRLLETKLHAYINHAENATQMNKEQDAKESLDKASSVLKNYPESNLNPIFYQAQGLLYHGQSKFEKAVASYDLGIKSARLHGDNSALNNLIFVKSQALSKLKKYSEARDLLIEMDKNNPLNIDDAKMCYNRIIINSEKMGDIATSYKYCKKYIDLTDSLYQTNSKREIAELETKYNSSEKEKKIVQLEAQKQNATLLSERSSLYYTLFGLLSFVLLLIVGFLWKNASSQKKLAAEKEKNYIQNLTALKNQKEMEVMQATISGEEEERKRIARDLHDGIGSRLSALKMRLVNKQNLSSEEKAKEADTLADLLNTSISELRQVAYNLVPETLLKLGLEHALRDLCHTLQTESVSINFQASEINATIPKPNQIAIFRIIQELINNALKHSECSEIIVDCSQNENLFLITVEDNGTGFRKEELESFSGLGFKNIKNRIDLLNGKLEIETEINKGTIFNIELRV